MSAEACRDACVIAASAVSPLGVGRAAYVASRPGERARVAIGRDDELARAGLSRPFAARAPRDLGAPGSGDRATDLLRASLTDLLSQLDVVRPGFRAERVGLALGTSSGGMLSAERFFRARRDGAVDAQAARRATYFAPLDEVFRPLGLDFAPCTQVLAACAASTIALGLALRWLDRGACDLVIAGGYDGVSVFVAAGFEVLRATTASAVRPFCVGRDGMALGEGAGLVALVRASDVGAAHVFVRVAGFGATNDAVHITAPDRTGRGLERAARAALADACMAPDAIGLVSAHGTATPYNDAMEARAIGRIFEGCAPPVVHPFKAQIGHTLGAAGVLESLATADALAEGVAPATAGEGAQDPDAKVLVLERAEARDVGAALKLSAAFGGTNAALVLTGRPSARRPHPPRAVYAVAGARSIACDLGALATATGVARDRLARLDDLCRLGLSAVAELAGRIGRDALAGGGIVAGHALATLDTNALFEARVHARGPALADPRLFPATSPNALVGECAIVYQLTGPAFSVGSGLDGATEALLAGAELIAAGDADRVLVVAADDAGPAARDLVVAAGWGHRQFVRGAAAVLLAAEPRGAALAIALDRTPDHAESPIGHAALLEMVVRLAAPNEGMSSDAASRSNGPG
jgi:3-oxoacyl-[acyl-carrier-protein] synthase II